MRKNGRSRHLSQIQSISRCLRPLLVYDHVVRCQLYGQSLYHRSTASGGRYKAVGGALVERDRSRQSELNAQRLSLTVRIDKYDALLLEC